ncbi:hypothetical protein KRR38_08460 [Novosphingobium sp. G106]|uniref:hypothetical protein n=1 Tax=Novosphingobium sp. G106 TaxID=2849500 RepID=UPI001C2CCE02|nr:hypothetical protein [Novosphingobium sp. G106]MBV1687705.1 hypothetical protein [Novosphingobium sp. G106]
MTKAQTLLQAGKQLAAVAAGRAFKGEPLKPDAENILHDPGAQKLDRKDTPEPRPAEKEGRQDPGNPNAVDHDDQAPGQERAKGSPP